MGRPSPASNPEEFTSTTTTSTCSSSEPAPDLQPPSASGLWNIPEVDASELSDIPVPVSSQTLQIHPPPLDLFPLHLLSVSGGVDTTDPPSTSDPTVSSHSARSWIEFGAAPHGPGSARRVPTSAPMALFETTHLNLRGTVPSDGDHLLRLHNDPLVQPWIEVGHLAPRHDSEKSELLKQTASALVGCIIEEKTTRAFVGTVGFVPQKETMLSRNRNVTVYIGLLPEFWGKGYAYEALSYMLTHAFFEMGMHKVALSVIDGNDRAVKLYEKLGFVEEGRDRHALWMRGGWRDVIRMGILENEWLLDQCQTANPAVDGEPSSGPEESATDTTL